MTIQRALLVGAFLAGVLIMTWILAAGWFSTLLAPLYWLAGYQAAHIFTHFAIFAGVVLLAPAAWRGSRLAMVVVGGAVALELLQLVAVEFAITRALLIDSTLDIIIDLLGGWTAWWLLKRRDADPHPGHDHGAGA